MKSPRDFKPLIEMPNGLTLVRKDISYNTPDQPVLHYGITKTVPGISHKEYQSRLSGQNNIIFQYDSQNKMWRPHNVYIDPPNQKKGVYTTLLQHMSMIDDVASSGTDPDYETKPNAAKAWKKLGANVETLLPAKDHNAAVHENTKAFVLRKHKNPLSRFGKK